jgi:hypothetical protein
VTRSSSGESSGALRTDGSSTVTVPGLPAWIPATMSAGAANGCGRADRSAWLGLFTTRSESSAQIPTPAETDQNPCRTSIQDPLLSAESATG